MTGLRPPPKRETPSRILGRFLVLIIMLFLLAAIIWAAVVNQRIPLVESTSLDSVETDSIEVGDGLNLNVSDSGESETAVFFLHDADLTGSALLAGIRDALGERVRTVAVDLPGFGLSTRLPGPGQEHTVADMARKVGSVIEARSGTPVVLVGVGLGGEVAAEISVSRPELVAGLAMIDVDFYSRPSWAQTLEKLPWFGLAVTHAFESRGPFSESTFAPYCDLGGWCPDATALMERDLATSIMGSTESIHGFRLTRPASEVPSRLSEVVAPSVFIWSQKGVVPEDSVDKVVSAVPGITLERLDVYQAHLESPAAVAEIVAALIP